MTTVRAGQDQRDTQVEAAGPDPLAHAGQAVPDIRTHGAGVGDAGRVQATVAPAPVSAAPAPAHAGQKSRDIQAPDAGVGTNGQVQAVFAAAPNSGPPAPVHAGQPRDDAHGRAAGVGTNGQARANDGPAPVTAPPAPDQYAALRIFSEIFADAQQARIACTNRAERGGVDPALYAGILAALLVTEKEARRAMLASYRRTVPAPIRAWQQATPGIGDHLLARLLGAIGDPVHAAPYHWHDGDPPAGHECGSNCKKDQQRHLIADPPFERNVAKLWAYCGVGDPSRKRRKGMAAEDAFGLGNPRAKMLVRLLAEACVKQIGTAGADAVSTPMPVAPSPSTLSAAEPPPTSNGAPRPAGVALEATPEAEPPSPAAEVYAPTEPGSRPAGVDDETTPEAEPPSSAAVHDPTPTTVARPAGDGHEASAFATPRRPTPRARSPLRDVYDQARATYASREDWTLGHQHAAALRKVGKALLCDLWRVASGLPPHHVPGGRVRRDTQPTTAPGDHRETDARTRSVPGGRSQVDAHAWSAPGGLGPRDTQCTNVPGGHASCDTHCSCAPGDVT